jgi:hypothetical protein
MRDERHTIRTDAIRSLRNEPRETDATNARSIPRPGCPHLRGARSLVIQSVCGGASSTWIRADPKTHHSHCGRNLMRALCCGHKLICRLGVQADLRTCSRVSARKLLSTRCWAFASVQRRGDIKNTDPPASTKGAAKKACNARKGRSKQNKQNKKVGSLLYGCIVPGKRQTWYILFHNS